MFKPAILGLAAVAGVVTLAAPASAYDPCRRATERSAEADEAVRRWIANHCNSGGQCVGNPNRFEQLRQEALAARRQREEACS